MLALAFKQGVGVWGCAGAPSEQVPSIPYVDPGNVYNSMLYLKLTGLHRLRDVPGDLMTPLGSGVGVGDDPDPVAAFGAWIEGDDELWELPTEPGDYEPMGQLIEQRCASCHDGTQAYLLDQEALLDPERVFQVGFHPRVTPGKPWRSAVFRLMILDHTPGLAGTEGWPEVQLSDEELKTIWSYIQPGIDPERGRQPGQ